MGLICVFMVACAALTNAQSVKVTPTATTVEIPDFEKAVKFSAGLIKAKKDTNWSVTLSATVHNYTCKYTDGNYTLSLNGRGIYRSTAIVAVRAYYTAYLLEKPSGTVPL